MAPRKYDMGKRAASVAETQARIVEAAKQVYAEVGFAGASIPKIARCADVAPGTVRYHFDSPEALLETVLQDVLESLHLPGPELFDGVDTAAERVRLLVVAMYDLYDRSTGWYQAFLADEDVPALKEAEERFYARVFALVQAALGPLAADPEASRVVFAMIGPHVRSGFLQVGFDDRAAADRVGALLASWLTRLEG